MSEEMEWVSVETLLRLIRVACGISLREAAARAGMTAVEFGEIERGKRVLHLDAALRIASAIATADRVPRREEA